MAKKSSSNFFWGLVAGSVAMYFLKDHVQGLVGSIKGSMRARSYYAPSYPVVPRAYHVRRRRGSRFQQFY